jgi:DNA polymerase II small subunit
MEKREVLKICMENGFFLDRGMLDYFVELDVDITDLIGKLKSLGVNEKILSLDVFDKYKDRLGIFLSKNKGLDDGFNILKNIKGNSGKIEAGDFVSYFRARFEEIRDIFIKKGGIENLCSIRRIGRDNGIFSIIGMVYDKRITKNKNLLIEVEDLTGRTIILVNRDNKQLFEQARNLLLDDIVMFKCSGSSKMLFASDFVYPDACLDSEKFGNKDEFVVFSGGFYIGSRNFLEDNLIKFISWLNGEVGDNRQKSLAKKVKYLILTGDNIEGVGVYHGQERDLIIKGCRGQYEKLFKILDNIRKDIEIIMIPGLHDAVWIGEPQPGINNKWGGNLNKMENLKLISNPSLVEIGGLKILLYYGGSISGFRNLIDGGGSLKINDFMKEILRRRHLAPVYGEMDIIPNKDIDDLVLNELPDIFVLGGQNRVMTSNYNNISIISTSCWQFNTDFEKGIGGESDPCKVPILNLKSKEVKILDFSDNEVKWEKGNDLVCELGGGKN